MPRFYHPEQCPHSREPEQPPASLLLGMEKCSFGFLCPSLSAVALPPGKRVSTFWMRDSTTAWMEETEAKSSCMGSLRDRGG